MFIKLSVGDRCVKKTEHNQQWKTVHNTESNVLENVHHPKYGKPNSGNPAKITKIIMRYIE